MKQTTKSLALIAGAKIRYERIRRNISQESLACKIGKTAQYISLLENGDRCGSVATYLSIATEFELSISGLFTVMKDNTHNSVNERDILELFYGCSTFEQRIMMKLLIATKNALRSES